MKPKPILSTLVIFAFFLLSCEAQEPTTWRGPDNGNYPDKGLLREWPANGPEILWSFDKLGQGHSSVAGFGDFLYTTGMIDNTGYLFKFKQDGELVFKAEYGPEFKESFYGTRGTPVITESEIFVVSGYGILYCLEKNDGSLRWKIDMVKDFGGKVITWGYNETPVVFGEFVYVTPGGETNCMVALKRTNGSLVWSTPATKEFTAYCTPLLFDHNGRKILTSHTAGHIFAVDALTGQFLWKHPQPNQWSVHANTPIYHDGGIFFFSGYGQGSGKLNLSEDGSKVSLAWSNETMDSRMGGAIYHDGYIYGSGDFKRSWKCIDWETGKNMWESEDIAKGVVIYADGMFYCYSDKGELALVKADPESFRVVSQTKVSLGTEQHWAHPSIYNGVLYLRHGQALIAYKIK